MRLKIIALLAVIVGGTAYSELQPTTKNAYETSRWAVYPAFDRPMFYVLQVDGHEYIVMWQYEERSITHSGNCTNHAPTVVTNVITVTNECSRQHVEPRNGWLGDGKIVTGEVSQIELTVNPGTNSWNSDDVAKKLCEIRGHTWQSGCGMMGCLVIHGGPIRHCTVCGITQTQDVGDWK